jgi:hypothetical protein
MSQHSLDRPKAQERFAKGGEKLFAFKRSGLRKGSCPIDPPTAAALQA